MAVIIENISTTNDPIGLNQYVVRVNNHTIAYFDHVREEGLGACLRLAAVAVDHAEAEAIDLARAWRRVTSDDKDRQP